VSVSETLSASTASYLADRSPRTPSRSRCWARQSQARVCGTEGLKQLLFPRVGWLTLCQLISGPAITVLSWGLDC